MYYRQPKYYEEFKCSGSGCISNCCFGWLIDWSKDEIDNIINSPRCSNRLKEIIQKGFTPLSGERFVVNLLEDGRCPCQTEEGLCVIQKEQGAEYLSKACSNYPKHNIFITSDKGIYRGCNLSCPEVVKKLVNAEDAAELVSVPIKEKSVSGQVLFSDHEKDFSLYPALKYRRDFFEFFYELIGNDVCSFETAVVLGALSAQKLTQLINNEQYDRITDALTAFEDQIHNAAALDSIKKIKPNYNVKFGIADKIIEDVLDFRMTDVLKNENGELDIDRYLTGEARLNEMMRDKPYWLRNIALNLLLELSIPFKKKEYSVFENYSFFVAAVSCLKLNAVAAAFAPEKINIQTKGQTLHFEGLEKIYGLTGIISRRIFQNDTAFYNVIQVLNEFGMNSSAYLALLVK